MPKREINGDLRLSPGERLSYLLENFRRNCKRGLSTINPERYIPWTLCKEVLPASPSRACTETFIRNQLPLFLKAGSINVLDVGCGSGRFSSVLGSIGFSGKYVGIDVDDRFRSNATDESDFERTFHRVDAHQFQPQDQFDLILSVSALEHIYDDDKLIKHLDQMLSQKGMQLHAVPGPWALPVYLWHGYRQYNLSKIEQRFGSDNVRVFSIGGWFSFLLHFLMITIGEYILKLPMRKWFRRSYLFLNGFSNKLDGFLPPAPTCYVVLKNADPCSTWSVKQDQGAAEKIAGSSVSGN